MNEINDKEIEHLAELSALTLTKAEKNKMTNDLAQILTFIDAISEVDAQNQHIDSSNTTLSELRDDVVKQSISQNEALINAPSKENGAFVISKVVD